MKNLPTAIYVIMALLVGFLTGTVKKQAEFERRGFTRGVVGALVVMNEDIKAGKLNTGGKQFFDRAEKATRYLEVK